LDSGARLHPSVQPDRQALGWTPGRQAKIRRTRPARIQTTEGQVALAKSEPVTISGDFKGGSPTASLHWTKFIRPG